MTLNRTGDVEFRLALRYAWTQDGQTRIETSDHAVTMDLNQLDSMVYSRTEEYGRLLGQSLFAESAALRTFETARAVANEHQVPLHVRLHLSKQASVLHRLRWESLRVPVDGDGDSYPLCTGNDVVFWRYMTSARWRPYRLGSRGELRVLAVLSNPAGLPPGLAEIKVDEERARLEKALGPIRVRFLAEPDQCTPENIVRHLRRGFDVLYIIAHGNNHKKRGARIWLADSDGKAVAVDGHFLAERLGESSECPRLVVLASCQSAGAGDERRDDSALLALGPLLVDAGVPAVLAMRGNVRVATVERFIPAFFESLREHGDVSQATAVARAAIRDLPDWWAPVLLSRLEQGSLWYRPGLGSARSSLRDAMPHLLESLRRKRYAAIVGSGLAYPFYGSFRDIARNLAREHNYPLPESRHNDLPEVAQYLEVHYESEGLMRAQLFSALCRELDHRYELGCGDELATMDEDIALETFERLLERAVEVRRKRDTEFIDPYKVMARCNIHTFVTTNFDMQLERALKEAGKEPRAEIFPWNEDLQSDSIAADIDVREFNPTVETPLVYHLFGNTGNPESLVLTEDNYFDFLIGWVKHEQSIPNKLLEHLVSRPLLILGYRLDDWHFRVLMRVLVEHRQRSNRRKIRNVAAQLEPSVETLESPGQARAYLEKYFDSAATSTDLYWGGVQDLLRELEGMLDEAA